MMDQRRSDGGTDGMDHFQSREWGRGGGGGYTATVAVAAAVADREGVSVDDLPALGGIVGADALNRLLDAATGEGLLEVSFDYAGYRVTVTDDREVSLRER